MAGPHWLDRLETELRRRRLPASYRARMLEELADHVSELEQENASMEAPLLLDERLGTPRALAAEARSEYDRRSFAGRHPVLTFGVAPLFAAIGTLLAALLTTWLVVWLACMTTPQLLESGAAPTPLQWCIVYGVLWFVRIMPFVLTAWLFARAGRRAHRPNWGLLACSIVAALAFVFWMDVRTGTNDVKGQVFFGLQFMQLPFIEQWLQAALPLSVGLWTWWSMVRHEHRRPALTGAT